jgi:glucokinase
MNLQVRGQPTKAIGIDLGGTKTALGIIAREGTVLESRKVMNREIPDFAHLLDHVVETVRELCTRVDDAESVHIGVATCELVSKDGDICSATSIPWTRADLLNALGSFGRVTLEADVRASALAEAQIGAGAPYETFLHVTVGTGISCCLVRNGVPEPGARGFAQLIGSAPVTIPSHDDGGAPTTLTLEDVASGPALVRRYSARAPGTAEAAEDVLVLADDGNELAATVVTDAATMLGSFMGLLINVLDPEAVVVGGGLGSAGGRFWETVVAATRTHIWTDQVRTLPIVRAHLGPDAALIGAGLVALTRNYA